MPRRSSANPVVAFLLHGSLVLQIVIGLSLGTLLALVAPETALRAGFLGDLFIGALKAIAPILVFILVLAALANHRRGGETRMGTILLLYLAGTFAAALVAVLASFAFPVQVTLQEAAGGIASPGNIFEVLRNLVTSIVVNPVQALLDANYLGILAWAIGLGLALRNAGETTRELLGDLATAIIRLVHAIIRTAPIGLFGLLAATLAGTGFGALAEYAQLLALLLGCMLFIALVMNPLIVFLTLRANPFPLVFTCLRESGITAFFIRSSAANIPVNLALCEKLGLPKDTYSVSIPLGATINMAGAAVTITVMTMAMVHTLGIPVDLPTALLLSVLAAIGACGASGVAGGSLLLIPLAASLFGIPNDVAMQMVGVGFIIGVLQDSTETALNSSTDVLFTAAATWRRRRASATAAPGGAT